LFKTQMRYGGTVWGNQNFAWVVEFLQGKQTQRISKYNATTNTLETMFEYNSTDAYSDQGDPETEKNQYFREVIKVTDNKILLVNNVGASPKGDLPFINSYDIDTKITEPIWRCKEGSFEQIISVLNSDKLEILTRRESKTEAPNYFIKNLKDNKADVAITNFTNPYPALQGVTKQKLKYKRADGVDLHCPCLYGHTLESLIMQPMLLKCVAATTALRF
jgi:dipeptidyl aminopeptidase/acylaminoacyl peptidase